MTSVKTAISLQQSLSEQIGVLAAELQISRSRLFALAAEEFIQRHQNQKLLEAINAAYADLPDVEEQSLRHEMRQQHRQLVEGQW
ncbi:MAG TPA: CopG family transcriptional regulator [Thermoflexia bacterium]|nr:CopG family transcriptional regulator [Thermoflexia bacterium]